MPARRWTDKDLVYATASSRTVSAVLRNLGLSTSPGNYTSFKIHAKRLQLDTSHFTGRAHGTSLPPNKIETSTLLVRGRLVQSAHLRQRLLKDGLIEEKCFSCDCGPTWNDQRLVLQLDHINGDPSDNRLENLRLLCPNCHSQTATFGARNFAGRYTKPKIKCPCGKVIFRTSKLCTSCNGVASRKEWPLVEEIVMALRVCSYEEVGRRLGVTGAAVKKHIKRCGVSPGYRRSALAG